VGFVSVGTLQQTIRDGLDSLEVGQVSDVLPNQAGFNIFKVTDRHPEREYTLEEVKDDLPDAVAQVQFREKYDNWLKQLRAKAQIEYRKY
jgi:parvulin-like peptidyl-prolyl isomerase